MAPTASVAFGCRRIAAVSSALLVVPGAIWGRRVRSGVRSSSARRPYRGLLPTGSASHHAASRHRGFPGSQAPQPGNLLQIHQHRVRLRQLAQTWLSSSPCSRLPCRGAVAKPTCSSAAFPWPWRSSTVWAMRRRVPGRMPHATGGVAGWCSAYDAGWAAGEPLRACRRHRRGGPQGEAA